VSASLTVIVSQRVVGSASFTVATNLTDLQAAEKLLEDEARSNAIKVHQRQSQCAWLAFFCGSTLHPSCPLKHPCIVRMDGIRAPRAAVVKSAPALQR
jgi:hypothetical protein